MSVTLTKVKDLSADVEDLYAEMPSGLLVPSDMAPKMRALPKAFDLFAGCGGMSCGFHQAGWHVIAAQEWWPVAAETYLCNLGSPDTLVHVGHTTLPKAPKRERQIFEKYGGQTIRAAELFNSPGSGWIRGFGEGQHLPCEHFFLGDIREFKTTDILKTLGMEKGELDCIMGGPPCQGFSMAGKRQVMDPRNSLVFDFCRYVIDLAPKTMMMENVPGLLTMVTPEGIPVIDAICLALESGGYGTFDALRRSLAGSPDLRAAVKKTPREKEKQKDARRSKKRAETGPQMEMGI